MSFEFEINNSYINNFIKECKRKIEKKINVLSHQRYGTFGKIVIYIISTI